MAETKIQWADYTFNPWIGCTKVAPGCTHCYAESFAKRYNKAAWGPKGTRVKTSENNWRKPLQWNRLSESFFELEAQQPNIPFARRFRVFCASLADVFEDWPGEILNHKGERIGHERSFGDGLGNVMEWLTMDDLRRELFALIDQTPHLNWLVLTKRPENVLRMWPQCSRCCNKDRETNCAHEYRPRCSQCLGTARYRSNVWLGTSVSDHQTAEENIPKLRECRDLCPVLFVSAEPLLGPIRNNLSPKWSWADVDWVICGGESGPKARISHLAWHRMIMNDCLGDDTAFFEKQLGSYVVDDCHNPPKHVSDLANAVGATVVVERRLKLKDSKGGDEREWPPDLRVRQFPMLTTDLDMRSNPR